MNTADEAILPDATIEADAEIGTDASQASTPPRRGASARWQELTKARLSLLVVATTAAGFVLARSDASLATLGWAVLGTGLCAASASMFNQLIEATRDARMHRTATRPLPAGEVSRTRVFVIAMILAYAGAAILALGTNLLAAGLAAANIVVYALIYTPLKSRTTLNTLVGAVCGAIPPMIGWVAATGALERGAWVLGALLFVWQLPHFLALAWLLREDYERGGFAMLPVLDRQGNLTAHAIVATSLLLVPIGLLATLVGIAGWVATVITFLAGLAATWYAIGFARRHDNTNARRVFFYSLAYLPIVLIAMVLDPGPISPRAAVAGGRAVQQDGGPVPPPIDPHGGLASPDAGTRP